jgi:hypothetical protein
LKKISFSAILVISFFIFISGFLFNYEISSSLNFFKTFDSDGSYQTNRLLQMINNGAPHASGFYNYGNLHHFVSFYLVKFLNFLGWELSFRVAAISLYITQIISYIAAWWLSYLISLRITKNIIFAFASSSLLILSKDVFFWSYNIHPDVVQLPFLLACIYLLISPSYLKILFSAACVGLATGTKYIGVIYGLLVLGAYVYRVYQDENYNKFLAFSILCFFIVAFIIPNYSIVGEEGSFFRAIKYEAVHVAYGDGKSESLNGLLWFPLFWSEIPEFISLLCILFLTAAICSIFKRRNIFKSYQKYFLLSVLIVAIISMLHLTLAVNMRRARYAFHLYPLILVVSAYLFTIINKSFLKHSRIVNLILALFATFAMYMAYKGILSINNQRYLMQNDEKIIAGRYIGKKCDSSMQVLLPMYSYIDENFKFVNTGYTFTKKQIIESDILLLNESVPGRYVWPLPNNQFYKGNFDESDLQYKLFVEEVFNSKNFTKVFAGKSIIIYVRKEKIKQCKF